MPTFPKDLLAEHETLIFDKRPHWVAMIPATLWAILIVVGSFFALSWIDDPDWAKWAILLVAALGLIVLTVHPFLQWLYTNFVLTTDRLITRHGVIAKNSKEIPLERINDVTFTQSIIERMIGAGDLMLESAGERGQTRITNVRDPEGTQLTIYKETEKNNDRMMGRGDPVKMEPTIPEQIEALARLKEQGVISATEFETKKQELLRRL
jgi:uncharacterized membrane protein YdbT with pleckstrin-like domain